MYFTLLDTGTDAHASSLPLATEKCSGTASPGGILKGEGGVCDGANVRTHYISRRGDTILVPSSDHSDMFRYCIWKKSVENKEWRPVLPRARLCLWHL